MVSTGGGIAIAVVVILLAAAIGWVVFTQLRARRLGLPPPSLSEYLPWKRQSSAPSYGPPRPAPGGVVGWFNDQVRKFKNRNNRSAAGAYEQPLQTGAPRRGFGPLDPDEAWDSRVGGEADLGYYDGRGTAAAAGGAGASTEYQGVGRSGSGGYRGSDDDYSMNLAGPYGRDSDEDDRRGRAPGRGPNPFDDDNGESLRGVSPRPMEGHSRDSVDTRRSAFREEV